MALPDWLAGRAEIARVESRPAVTGQAVPWPDWVPAEVQAAMAAVGIERPWLHQAAAAKTVVDGQNLAIATPTATGKTLSYLLPALSQIAAAARDGDPTGPLFRRTAPTALYLAPTKALAHDQLTRFEEIELPGWAPACLDGDSDQAERRYAREFASMILTNPDMLHRSVLPDAPRWKRLLGNLRLVVIDECHRYRGSFGGHTAAVIRRLRRLCAAVGAHPVFVCASATSVDAGQAAERLTGAPDFVEVTKATSPRPALDFIIWQQGAASDLPGLMSMSVAQGRQTLGFVGSRKRAETVAEQVRGLVPDKRVVAYRAGYLPSERRALETGLRDGTISGAVATNALELGVDLGGLDTVIMDGFPGTLASMWQRAGRAGRRDRDALVVLIPAAQPLDAYLASHPELLFDSPVESTVLHPGNPYVLGPHLAAAAQELPLTASDADVFGPGFLPAVKALVARGLLRERPTGWFWTRPDRAANAIDLRGIGGRPVEIIEESTGVVVGTSDPSSADSTVHEGAVYLHQGQPWLVGSYNPDERTALVSTAPDDLSYVTQALASSEVGILGVDDSFALGAGTVSCGPVRMTSQVTSYLRRDAKTLDVWDQTPLDLPVHSLDTQAVWWTLPDNALDTRLRREPTSSLVRPSRLSAVDQHDEERSDEPTTQLKTEPGRGLGRLGLELAPPGARTGAGQHAEERNQYLEPSTRTDAGALDLAAAAHAAEHTSIGLLPAFAPCDRWDIGGLSTRRHVDTGELTVFVVDGYPGGAGFAAAGFRRARVWLEATLDRLRTCPCDDGCPLCVMSPKCGNANSRLDKRGAAILLALLVEP